MRKLVARCETETVRCGIAPACAYAHNESRLVRLAVMTLEEPR